LSTDKAYFTVRDAARIEGDMEELLDFGIPQTDDVESLKVIANYVSHMRSHLERITSLLNEKGITS